MTNWKILLQNNVQKLTKDINIHHPDSDVHGLARLTFKAGMYNANEHIMILIEALTKDRESVRELCALMAEGEGSDPEVYRIMAKAALKKIDDALEKLRKELESK